MSECDGIGLDVVVVCIFQRYFQNKSTYLSKYLLACFSLHVYLHSPLRLGVCESKGLINTKIGTMRYG